MRLARFAVWLAVVALGFQASAQAQVELNGQVRMDYRVRARGDHRLTWNENRLDLKVSARLSPKAAFFGETWIRSFGFPRATQLEQLQERDRRAVQPWAIDLREAYLDLFGFLWSKLDVRIGKQRIAWGTADKINPTDNLNPKDFEDPLDFGRKLPVNALRMFAYLGGWTLELDYVPTFTPAVLPPPGWEIGETVRDWLPGDPHRYKLTCNLQLPPAALAKSANLGAKVSTTIAGYDLSASYAYVREDIPLPTRAELDLEGNTLAVTAELEFPRLHVLGADVAGQLLGVGLWAEVAAFRPESAVTLTIVPPLPGYQRHAVLPRRTYTKYAVGGDYTWRNGIYLNAQYVHGFYGERGKDGLQEYLLLAVEKKLLHETLKLRLGSLVQTPRIRDYSRHRTWILLPELGYYPVDNVELVLGGYAIGSRGRTTLSSFEGNDEVFVKMQVSF